MHILWLLSVVVSSMMAPAPPAAAIRLVNGRWFDGTTFQARTLYAVDGRFTDTPPSGAIVTDFDLAGRYIIPPFADAHCHNFDGSYNVAQQVSQYLADGVYYAKVLTNLRSGAAATAARLNVPRSVDVSFAHGALTHTNGHGFEVYEALALGIVPEAKVMVASRAKIAASRLAEGDAYYLIDDAAMLDAKWPQILAGKPAFLKVHLVGSERFAAKKAMLDSIALGDIGIDPSLLPEIVTRAHSVGLRVSAHVETITDYRVALSSGVDEIAHLPGYYLGDDEQESLKQLSIADARETARRGTWVVVSPVATDYEPPMQARVNALVAFNLRLLKDAGARIALGSDRYGRSPRDDGLRLATLGVFSNLEVLKLWTEATPQTIFPDRRLGRLAAGYEASFLALTGNPLDDFANITTITARMKQGVLLDFARP